MNLCSLLLGVSVTLMGPASEPVDKELTIDSVLITPIEQVEVPAQAAGVLASVDVREGDLVTEEQLLARIDDTVEQHERNRVQAELQIARDKADNDINVRFAKKSLQVAQAELKRANESVKRFSKSISATELDRLKLAVERVELEIEQAQRDLKTARLTAESKENEFRLADYNVQRRRIVAPISGVVVQVNRQKGEWVEPGKLMVRILRMNRLRAEGFADASLVGQNLAGRPVTLTVELPGKQHTQFHGKLVFISPEINPVNGQVRIWAEIENRDLLLRPGLQASMTIHPAESASADDGR